MKNNIENNKNENLENMKEIIIAFNKQFFIGGLILILIPTFFLILTENLLLSLFLFLVYVITYLLGLYIDISYRATKFKFYKDHLIIYYPKSKIKIKYESIEVVYHTPILKHFGILLKTGDFMNLIKYKKHKEDIIKEMKNHSINVVEDKNARQYSMKGMKKQMKIIRAIRKKEDIEF